MKIFKNLLLIVVPLIILSGCFTITPRVPQTNPAGSNSATLETIKPTITVTTPIPTEVPTIEPTVTPYVPIEGTIVLENMVLRKGPGFLYADQGIIPVGEKVSVLGRALGDNWLKISTKDSLTGWMKVEGIATSGRLSDFPYITPTDGMIIHGTVYTYWGNPASFIQVFILPVGATDTKMQDVAISDFMGKWYIYFPADVSGDFSVWLNGYSCNSNISTTMCRMLGNYPPPITISLPLKTGESINIDMVP